MNYIAEKNRYTHMQYRRCGDSGLKLPLISLGFWHNFGRDVNKYVQYDIMARAFDMGITYFDLANNYGPPNGSAEENFGELFAKDFMRYRDEIIVATKAGWQMWDGPYGDHGSKKHLTASLDQSLRRMNLDYVDIFYHHRYCEETNIEEVACALDLMVRQGKALYIGVSNYNEAQTRQIAKLFKEMRTPFILNQPSYNMFNRKIEEGLDKAAKELGIGLCVYSPLAQGLLTDRYFNGFPDDSRVNKSHFLSRQDVESVRQKVIGLNEIANGREQALSQMALSWALNNSAVTSVIIGTSSVEQLVENVKAIEKLKFSTQELNSIDKILQYTPAKMTKPRAVASKKVPTTKKRD